MCSECVVENLDLHAPTTRPSLCVQVALREEMEVALKESVRELQRALERQGKGECVCGCVAVCVSMCTHVYWSKGWVFTS